MSKGQVMDIFQTFHVLADFDEPAYCGHADFGKVEFDAKKFRRFFRNVLKVSKQECRDCNLSTAFKCLDRNATGYVLGEQIMDFVTESWSDEPPTSPKMKSQSPRRCLGSSQSGPAATIPFNLNGRATIPRSRFACGVSSWNVPVGIPPTGAAESFDRNVVFAAETFDRQRSCEGIAAEIAAWMPPKAKEFVVELQKTPSMPCLGINADVESTKLKVVGVREGLVHDYNAATELEKQIRVGDYIKSVNGVSGVQPMTEETQDADSLSLVIRRPFEASDNTALRLDSAGLVGESGVAMHSAARPLSAAGIRRAQSTAAMLQGSKASAATELEQRLRPHSAARIQQSVPSGSQSEPRANANRPNTAPSLGGHPAKSAVQANPKRPSSAAANPARPCSATSVGRPGSASTGQPLQYSWIKGAKTLNVMEGRLLELGLDVRGNYHHVSASRSALQGDRRSRKLGSFA
jgi:hypothetical protein